MSIDYGSIDYRMVCILLSIKYNCVGTYGEHLQLFFLMKHNTINYVRGKVSGRALTSHVKS